MVKPLKWLTRPIRRRRAEQQQVLLKKRFSEVAMEAADAAADRAERKEDYGSILEQAAGLAQERMDIRGAKVVVVTQVADIFAERTTVRQTAFHLLKGNIGPGCLSLPWCFSQLGIPLGIVLTAVIGFWTYYNCMTILHVKGAHTSNRRTITYSDLGEVAYGKRFRTFVTVSIVLLQLAVCTVYLSFVGSNLQSFFQAFVPGLPLLGQNPAWSIVLVVPVAVAITLMPNLKALGPVSEMAMVVLFVAFGILGVVLAENWQAHQDMPSVNWSSAPMAVCGILYSFEGICIVLPLEASMKDRTHFTTLFSWAYVGVTLLYCCIGAICVFVLGEVTSGSITSYLMSHSEQYHGYLLVTTSNLLASFAVLFTYALTMFPCIELWCQVLEREERGDDTLEPAEDEEDWWGGELAYGPHDTPILRLSLVAATVVVAAAVPNVTELIGLAGAIAGAATALIVPPLLALHFAPHHDQGHVWRIVMFEFGLLALGILFGLVGTSASLYDIYATIVAAGRRGA